MPRVHWLDCSRLFLTADSGSIDPTLLPDGVHPNAAGHELLAQCLDPLLQRLLGPVQAPIAGAGGATRRLF